MSEQTRCVLSHEAPTDAVVGRLCDHHYAAVREQLQDCMEMYAILPEFLLPGSTAHESDESKYTKKSTIPAPIRLDVLALNDPRNAVDLEWSYKSNWDQSKGKLTGNGSDIPTFEPWLDGWAEYVRENVTDETPDRTDSVPPVPRTNTDPTDERLHWVSRLFAYSVKKAEAGDIADEIMAALDALRVELAAVTDHLAELHKDAFEQQIRLAELASLRAQLAAVTTEAATKFYCYQTRDMGDAYHAESVDALLADIRAAAMEGKPNG